MDEVKYLQLARNLSAFREKLQVCARRWMFVNVNQFCGYWLTKFWSIRKALPFATPSRFPGRKKSYSERIASVPTHFPGSRQPSYLLRPRSSYTILQKHVGLGIQV